MEIKREVLENSEVFHFSGRLDTTTSPLLDEELNKPLEKEELVFDFKELEYVSSAGLRLILKAYKSHPNNFSLVNVRNEIKEVLDITGFSDFLIIK